MGHFGSSREIFSLQFKYSLKVNWFICSVFNWTTSNKVLPNKEKKKELVCGLATFQATKTKNFNWILIQTNLPTGYLATFHWIFYFKNFNIFKWIFNFNFSLSTRGFFSEKGFKTFHLNSNQFFNSIFTLKLQTRGLATSHWNLNKSYFQFNSDFKTFNWRADNFQLEF